jgi:hypothetical protein
MHMSEEQSEPSATNEQQQGDQRALSKPMTVVKIDFEGPIPGSVDDAAFYVQGPQSDQTYKVSSKLPDFIIRAKNAIHSTVAASSKCDFQAVNVGLGTRLGVASSKCDFGLDARRTDLRLRLEHVKNEFRLNSSSSLITTEVASSKCDVSIRSRNSANQVAVYTSDSDFTLRSVGPSSRVELSGVQNDLLVKTESPRTQFRVESSKCDWRVKAVSTSPLVRYAPFLEGEMSSSKCDYSLRLRFGQEGRVVHEVTGVLSSKCDFQVQQIRRLQ